MKYTFEELSNMHSTDNKHKIMPGDIVVTRIGNFIATNAHAPFCTRCPLYEAGCGNLHSICESGYAVGSGEPMWLKLVRTSDVMEEL